MNATVIQKHSTFVFQAFLFALLISTFISPSHAKMYKWIDEHGNPQYSDKPPGNQGQAEAFQLQSEHKPFQQVTRQQPVAADQYDKPTRLKISAPDWSTVLKNSDTKGYYYFGGDCVSPSQIATQNLTSGKHRKFLPSARKLTRQIYRQFKQANLSHPAVEILRAQEDIKSDFLFFGNLLTIDILDIQIHACAAVIENPNQQTAALDFSAKEFIKNRAHVKIDWKLSSIDQKTVYFQGLSEGSYDDWNANYKSSPAKAIVQASLAAADNILAKPDFVVALTGQTDGQPIPSTTNNELVSDNSGWLAQLLAHIHSVFDSTGTQLPDLPDPSSLQPFKNTTLLVDVLQISSVIRTAYTEYYFQTGDYPNTLADFGYESSRFEEEGKINYLYIDADGAITFELDAGYMVLFSPSESSLGGINWECLTDLDATLIGSDSCEKM